MNTFEAAKLLAEQATTEELPITLVGDGICYEGRTLATVQMSSQSWANRGKPRKVYVSVGPYGDRRTYRLSDKTGKWTPGAVAAIQLYGQQVRQSADRGKLEKECRNVARVELRRLGIDWVRGGPICPTYAKVGEEMVPAVELGVDVPLEYLDKVLELLELLGLYEPEPTSQIEDSRDAAELPAVQ